MEKYKSKIRKKQDNCKTTGKIDTSTVATIPAADDIINDNQKGSKIVVMSQMDATIEFLI